MMYFFKKKKVSNKSILAIRGMLYELLTHCIPATQVLKTLSASLSQRVDEQVKGEVVHWAAFYVSRIIKKKKKKSSIRCSDFFLGTSNSARKQVYLSS